MRVSALQYEPEYLNVSGNLDTVESLIGTLDTDLLVLPELFASGYFFRDPEDLASVAEHVPGGASTLRLEQWAARFRCVIVAGVAERANGLIYNSAVVVGPSGYVGTYRKLHLYYEEKLLFRAGDSGLPVYHLATRDGVSFNLGVMVCFDWYFPETARSLALAGADIIAHPSNLVRRDCPRAMPIRALENHVFTVTANRTGSESNGSEELRFIGKSLICSPFGDVLASLGREDIGVLTADVDPSLSSNRRITRHNDLFADRRTDCYRLE